MNILRTCITCFYNEGDTCSILNTKIPENCFAWADEKEAVKREEACKKYKDDFINEKHFILSDEVIKRRISINEENKIKRGGKSTKEVLDEGYMKLYRKGLTDTEISEKLFVGRCYVAEYRRDLKLESNKKTAQKKRGGNKK